MKAKKISLLIVLLKVTIQVNSQTPPPSIFINNSGLVGIGTQTSTTALQVNGTVTGTSFTGSGAGLVGIPGQWSVNEPYYYIMTNVGIGTNTPTTSLQVNGTLTATSFTGNGAGLTGIPGQWSVNGSSVYNMDNVGIGTSSPAEVLELNGNIRGNISGGALQINTANLISSGANAYAQIGPQNGSFCHFYTNTPSFAINEPITMIYSAPICAYVSSQGTAYNLQFNTNNTERMVILGNGYIGIGVTSPAFMLDLGTGSNAIIRSSNVSITSDSTLKKNIQNLKGARASLLKLRGVTYQFKSNTSVITANNLSFPEDPSINPDSSKNKLPSIDTTNSNQTHIGFLAQ